MKLLYKNPLYSKVVLFVDEDGTEHAFTYQNGKWVAPFGVFVDLQYDSSASKFKIINKANTIYQFDTSGKLESMKDTNGNTTAYTYNADATLQKITDASGRYVTFSYAGGKLDTVSGSQITKVKYSYDVNGNLQKVENIATDSSILSSVTYGYDAGHNLTSVIYDTNDRVQKYSQTITQNGTPQTLDTAYAYTENADGSFVVTKTDPKEIVTKFYTNDVGNITKIEDAYGTSSVRTNNLTWDQNHLLTQVTDPRIKSIITRTGKTET